MRVKNVIAVGTVLLYFLTFSPVSWAQEQAPTPTQVHYDLPYPGILPDNPFYFLKAIRDRISEFFLSNPQEKAQFDLQQANKRIEAAYMLVLQDKEKAQLAGTTASKAVNYLEESVTNASAAKKQGIEIVDIARQLTLADAKYIEVLQFIETKVDKKDRQSFVAEEKRIRAIGRSIKQIK